MFIASEKLRQLQYFPAFLQAFLDFIGPGIFFTLRSLSTIGFNYINYNDDVNLPKFVPFLFRSETLLKFVARAIDIQSRGPFRLFKTTIILRLSC